MSAESLHSSALVVDLHTDALYFHARGLKDITRRSDSLQVDIPRLRAGGVDAQVFAIWPNPRLLDQHRQPASQPATRGTNPYLSFVLAALDTLDQICRRHPELITLVRSPAELSAAVSSGRIAAIAAIEGGHALQDDLALLDTFYNRGLRLLTLTWNNSNHLADASADVNKPNHGLSPLGFQALRRMNELGIIVDISHASPETFQDVADSTTAPIIASHSGIAALCDRPRNLTDNQLRTIARTGGVVGIIFYPPCLRRDHQNATLEDVLDQIDYVRNLVGPDYVALGSDFDGLMGPAPHGLEDATCFPAITIGLRNRGWPENDIRKVLGGNFLRVWTEVCERADTNADEPWHQRGLGPDSP